MRTNLFPRLDMGPADRILERMVADGAFCQAGRCFALPEFAVRFTPEQEMLRDKLLNACKKDLFAPPERSALSREHGKGKDYQKVLDYLTDEGELIPLEPDLLFAREAVEKAEALFRGLAQDGPVTLAQFRDAIGTSRKFAMALLEYWDVTGLTRKTGDARVLAKP